MQLESSAHSVHAANTAAPDPQPEAPAAATPPEWERSSADASAEHEAIAANLTASLRVYNTQHLFAWTQGLLQNLIPHEALLCLVRRGESDTYNLESFSTAMPEPDSFDTLYRQDPYFANTLIKQWQTQHFQPVVQPLGAGGGAMFHELARIGAETLIGHGTFNPNGQVVSFFIFACRAGKAEAAQTRMAEILVPFLHTALMRAKVNLLGERVGARSGQTNGRDILTQREQEVLKWVYMGKSNVEIGLILGISHLTVKNHVQEILRRLNVQNRAQAVGKALKLSILTC